MFGGAAFRGLVKPSAGPAGIQPTGKLAFKIGFELAARQEARGRRGTRPSMALAYTAFGYFSLLIVLALVLPGH
jgi:hypothetical protein